MPGPRKGAEVSMMGHVVRLMAKRHRKTAELADCTAVA
ncbi:hypothetical protein ASZ90_001218 [hydrocarbon metagenome]|uniref:Uncharacterized protein n=1 Tax=hydrocarbon metagenome TaxID=938273 RepID=A0A0W8G6W7_9ZZZZ